MDSPASRNPSHPPLRKPVGWIHLVGWVRAGRVTPQYPVHPLPPDHPDSDKHETSHSPREELRNSLKYGIFPPIIDCMTPSGDLVPAWDFLEMAVCRFFANEITVSCHGSKTRPAGIPDARSRVWSFPAPQPRSPAVTSVGEKRCSRTVDLEVGDLA